jgi:quercetin dioxygenase-like cupin family protein
MRVVLVAGMLAALARGLNAQTAADTAALHWTAVPSHLPAGAQVAIVSGDPTKAVLTTADLMMPDGYTMPAHFHPVEEQVEVLEGTLLIGVGEVMDQDKAMQANAGDMTMLHPGTQHYFIAKGRTRVRVTFMGPYTVTYVGADHIAGEVFYPFGH